MSPDVSVNLQNGEIHRVLHSVSAKVTYEVVALNSNNEICWRGRSFADWLGAAGYIKAQKRANLDMIKVTLEGANRTERYLDWRHLLDEPSAL